MFLPALAKKIFPDWNVKPIEATVAYEYCRKNRVTIIECNDEITTTGMYTVYKDFEFILINKNLSAAMYAWVWLHEIFHREAHYPETSHFSLSMESKNDAEANIFAAVAQMPKAKIAGLTVDEVCWLFELPEDLAKIRLEISENLGY